MTSDLAISNLGRVGRYRLIKRIAVGGMADIWLAQEFGARGYERTAVVKTIRGDLVDDEDVIPMLMEEARIASCLKHENIAELYEVGRQDGTHYLAMEFVFGRDLRQLRDRCLERGLSIPPKHVVTIVAAVLDALHYAYNEAEFEGRPLHVVHRDVSPQNILVGFDGCVKLLDFGMAKAAAQLSRTRAGVLKGKYAYMSPEQVDFKELDQRADVFSVGVVLWEMLTEERLFYRGAEYETVKAVMACRVPFPKSVKTDLPWVLSFIAWRALRRRPAFRYTNAQLMREALLRFDARSPEKAKDELSEWMSQIFEEELARRDVALGRAWRNPSQHRQIQEAGFELVDAKPTPSAPPPRREGTAAGRHRSVSAVLSSAFSSQGWFTMVLLAIVVIGVSMGILLGTKQRVSSSYGYLTIRSSEPGVEVTVGGRRMGPAPVTNIAVLPGRHRIVGFMRGDRQTVEVEIHPGESRTVELRLEPK
ncbi:MAG: serine/threonine protein kinase [Deltaproteobacteria bacterium]|nr:serine/threonine protein kinase [Deltaproteobacteria bacterium]